MIWPILSPILCLAMAFGLFKAYQSIWRDWRYQERSFKRYGCE